MFRVVELWNNHDPSYSEVYDWTILFLYSIVHIVIITILYVRIFRSIKRSMEQCQGSSSDQRDITNIKRLKSNRKTMILLVTALVAFVICIFPNKIRRVLMAMIAIDVLISHCDKSTFIYRDSWSKISKGIKCKNSDVLWKSQKENFNKTIWISNRHHGINLNKYLLIYRWGG